MIGEIVVGLALIYLFTAPRGTSQADWNSTLYTLIGWIAAIAAVVVGFVFLVAR